MCIYMYIKYNRHITSMVYMYPCLNIVINIFLLGARPLKPFLWHPRTVRMSLDWPKVKSTGNHVSFFQSLSP